MTEALPITHIYEVVDASCDEMYYSLGTFTSYEEAKREVLAVAAYEQDCAVSEYCNDEWETIEIRERPVGWCSNTGVLCLEMHREVQYTPENDSNRWVTVSCKEMTFKGLKNTQKEVTV